MPAIRNTFGFTNCQGASHWYGGDPWVRLVAKFHGEHRAARDAFIAGGGCLGPARLVDQTAPDYDGRVAEWRSEILP